MILSWISIAIMFGRALANKDAWVGRPSKTLQSNALPPRAKILQSKPSPLKLKKKSHYILCLRGRKFFSPPSAPKNITKPYIFEFYFVFMHYWSNCGPFQHKTEHQDAEMLILNVRAKMWDFFNVRTQKWVRPKCHWNVIFVLSKYMNLVKFSINLQNLLKRRLRCRFGRFAPENPKTLQSNPPPSARNPAIDPPTPQGVRDPIISSAWTSGRARMGLMHPWW